QTHTAHTVPSANHPSTTEIYTLSLHDALPISCTAEWLASTNGIVLDIPEQQLLFEPKQWQSSCCHFRVLKRNYGHIYGYFSKIRDRKSTRLNSSHVKISYAVFCLKKKNKQEDI